MKRTHLQDGCGRPAAPVGTAVTCKQCAAHFRVSTLRKDRRGQADVAHRNGGSNGLRTQRMVYVGAGAYSIAAKANDYAVNRVIRRSEYRNRADQLMVDYYTQKGIAI